MDPNNNNNENDEQPKETVDKSKGSAWNRRHQKSIVVEDFRWPDNTWTTLNDPVMGGKSYSSVKIADGIASFTGKCAIVPSLQAPGFITMETGNSFTETAAVFPDISTCEAFSFELRTNTAYEGYRVSFGKAHPKGGRFAYGYKAPLSLETLPPVGEFGSVVVPFSSFSDKWNDATGDIEIECKDDPSYCPSEQWLESMETMSFWGEGVEGMVDLEVKSISATGCDGSATGIAVAPPRMQSKIHTIRSNPVYTGMAVAIVVLASIVGLCLFCCCCYRGKRRKSNTTTSPIVGATTSAFKDDAAASPAEGFVDEIDEDLEENNIEIP